MSQPIDDGGMAFPSGEAFELTDRFGRKTLHSKASLHSGMTLLAYLASQETLANLTKVEKGLAEAVAGQMPVLSDHVGVFKWECKVRAELKVMRAEAVLAALRSRRGA